MIKQFSGSTAADFLLYLWEKLERDQFGVACVLLWFVWRVRNDQTHRKHNSSLDQLSELAGEWLFEYQSAQRAVDNPMSPYNGVPLYRGNSN